VCSLRRRFPTAHPYFPGSEALDLCSTFPNKARPRASTAGPNSFDRAWPSVGDRGDLPPSGREVAARLSAVPGAWDVGSGAREAGAPIYLEQGRPRSPEHSLLGRPIVRPRLTIAGLH
jgi:hypothetical protein